MKKIIYLGLAAFALASMSDSAMSYGTASRGKSNLSMISSQFARAKRSNHKMQEARNFGANDKFARTINSVGNFADRVSKAGAQVSNTLKGNNASSGKHNGQNFLALLEKYGQYKNNLAQKHESLPQTSSTQDLAKLADQLELKQKELDQLKARYDEQLKKAEQDIALQQETIDKEKQRQQARARAEQNRNKYKLMQSKKKFNSKRNAQLRNNKHNIRYKHAQDAYHEDYQTRNLRSGPRHSKNTNRRMNRFQ